MKDDLSIRKIQELFYELKVGDVMMKDVITVSSNMQMMELRAILRDNRISGTPVVDDGRLVGIISIEDFINWLAGGQQENRIAGKMNREVKTLYEDEPLVQAISIIEKFGYGRIPVINRRQKSLTGVITKGDIIEGLLKKMEVDYQEEEIHRYRASHFFEDIIADKTTLIFQYFMKGCDAMRNHDVDAVQNGGRVASRIRKTLRRLGIHPTVIRRTCIAIYEAEMNIILYAGAGEITVSIHKDEVNVKVKDSGPGIENIEEAMSPGFSTAPDWVRELGFGAGMGLINIRNCAQTFSIASEKGQGTVLNFGIPIGAA
ncbi:MAG: CBS domain-containing protein [Spirochaetales bacterium]|nr:CBS domain-containing protein [Spirochaetales bacterium]